ncbi:hypothetical protein BC835DRAFT_571607 [Cytidiella melzeri]|nr:hypothetical protein BC835DRAFT_571607 [Cytidiella melzeri]
MRADRTAKNKHTLAVAARFFCFSKGKFTGPRISLDDWLGDDELGKQLASSGRADEVVPLHAIPRYEELEAGHELEPTSSSHSRLVHFAARNHCRVVVRFGSISDLGYYVRQRQLAKLTAVERKHTGLPRQNQLQRSVHTTPSRVSITFSTTTVVYCVSPDHSRTAARNAWTFRCVRFLCRDKAELLHRRGQLQ